MADDRIHSLYLNEDLFPFSRGAREGSTSDATHGRVVMAVCSKSFQYCKYLFALKQAMSALIAGSNMEFHFTAK